MASPAPSPNDLTRQQLDELDALLQRMLSLPITPPSIPAPPPSIALPVTPPGLATPAERPIPASPVYPLPPQWDSRSTPPIQPPLGWRTDSIPAQPKIPHITEPTVGVEALSGRLTPIVPPVAEEPASSPTRDPQPTIVLPAPGVRPESASELQPTNLASHPVEERKAAPIEPLSDSTDYPLTGTLRGVDAPLLPPGYALPDPEQPANPLPVPTPTPVPVSGADSVRVTPAPDAPVPARPSTRRRVPVLLLPVVAVNAVLEIVLGLLGPVGTAAMQPTGKHVLGWSGVLMLVTASVWVGLRLTGIIG